MQNTTVAVTIVEPRIESIIMVCLKDFVKKDVDFRKYTFFDIFIIINFGENHEQKAIG